MRPILFMTASLLAMSAAAASAQVSTTADPATAQTGAVSGQGRVDGTAGRAAPNAPSDIVVTARRLDEARAAIQPSLGATSYTITNDTIQALPGGDNQPFNQIILQLPGVVQDGFGQFHVRDDHNNLQYRINGTILPEGIAVFGQTLSPRIIDRFNLLTGALPAQYGLRTAGIIDITTKSGLFADGGSASIYGGSNGTIQPSVEYGGHSGNTNFFVSGDYRHSDRGIEGVDDSRTPLHDQTDQFQAFTYIDHTIDDSHRISFVGGYSNQYFQIPNPRGLTALNDGFAGSTTPPYAVGGTRDYPSDSLNERQIEKTAFGQIALLHDHERLTYQLSAFARYSSLRYRPDDLGELLFNGQAQQAYKTDFAIGGQVDAAYKLNDTNTVRGGAVVTRDRGSSRTSTLVFPVANDGTQAGQPFALADDGGQTSWTESVYLQDELKLLPVLTFNFGGRFDHYCGYRCEQQFSPRANLVYSQAGTTVHLGYARYFSPPPFELVATTSVASFQGTSAQANSLTDTTPFAERQHYIDLGFQQKLGGAFSFGVDGYLRYSHYLIDEGQFGAPIVLTPFNYNRGRIHGVEANASYTAHGLLAYANFAYAKAQGKDIVSSQFSFSQDDLDYIRNHYIYLDHDQTYTASGGFSYKVQGGALRGLRFGADALYGSGLRADGEVPNGRSLPGYAVVNLSTSYRLDRPGIAIRFDVANVGDHVYEIRDGSGIGVGAPQYGARRGFFVGLTKDL
ncbi:MULTISPECIES: TonB-dependent receptor [unclassified Sphingomonas]|uniref:TonB-dependent receptor n=1 Tax=unclassified Sphingomonas TaxID=196159 RepID=UPI00226AA62E|nr:MULTISPECIES: TonB-dependent receptor [unclassified Sphingomonas]